MTSHLSPVSLRKPTLPDFRQTAHFEDLPRFLRKCRFSIFSLPSLPAGFYAPSGFSDKQPLSHFPGFCRKRATIAKPPETPSPNIFQHSDRNRQFSPKAPISPAAPQTTQIPGTARNPQILKSRVPPGNQVKPQNQPQTPEDRKPDSAPDPAEGATFRETSGRALQRSPPENDRHAAQSSRSQIPGGLTATSNTTPSCRIQW